MSLVRMKKSNGLIVFKGQRRMNTKISTEYLDFYSWRRLLRVPWTARRSNQSILKEINPEYSLERLMLNLQCFGHLMRRADSLEKTLKLGKIEGRRRGLQRMIWLDGITNSMDKNWTSSRSWWWTGSLACWSPECCKELNMTDWATIRRRSLKECFMNK